MHFSRKISTAYRVYKQEGALALARIIFRRTRDDSVWALWSMLSRAVPPVIWVNDYRLAVHPHDYGISKELALYRVHEPSATSLLIKLFQPGQTVIDVGSNIGYYAILEARAVGRLGRVVAIEPESKNRELLLQNVRRNSLDNVVVLPYAIGDEDGTAKLYLANQSNTHSLSKPPGNTTRVVEVEIRKLDFVVRAVELQRVDIVRMDIEGWEIEALAGMESVLRQFRPSLVIEVHIEVRPWPQIRAALASLLDLGYELKYVVDRDLDFKWKPFRSAVTTGSLRGMLKTRPKYRVMTCFLLPAGAT